MRHSAQLLLMQPVQLWLQPQGPGRGVCAAQSRSRAGLPWPGQGEHRASPELCFIKDCPGEAGLCSAGSRIGLQVSSRWCDVPGSQVGLPQPGGSCAAREGSGAAALHISEQH